MMALAAGALLFTACGGTPGPTGATGTNGTNGNANVQQYTFGARAANNSIVFTIPNFTQAQLDSSTILTYATYPSSAAKYPIPGTAATSGCYASGYQVISGANLSVYVQQVKSTDQAAYCASPTALTSLTVIVIPNSSNVTLAKTSGLNLNDYNAVRKYYNLPE